MSEFLLLYVGVAGFPLPGLSGWYTMAAHRWYTTAEHWWYTNGRIRTGVGVERQMAGASRQGFVQGVMRPAGFDKDRCPRKRRAHHVLG